MASKSRAEWSLLVAWRRKAVFSWSGGDAAAVVRHPEEGHAPAGDLHRDDGGSGVHRVFDQLFGGAGGPLHHLAGGD